MLFIDSAYLKSLNCHCPRIVRVYSDKIVHYEFPIPDQPIGVKNKLSANQDIEMAGQHRDVVLHHLIRDNGKYDFLFLSDELMTFSFCVFFSAYSVIFFINFSTLHFPGGPSALQICKYDKKFRLYLEQLEQLKSGVITKKEMINVTIEDIEEYKDLIKNAERDVIKAAEVILCTCSASASPKLQKVARIKQVRLMLPCACECST